MKILISAFEPFGDSRFNSSLDTISALPREIGGAQINTVTLPVAYTLAGKVLCRAIDVIRPDAVISLGQARGRGKITPEYLAANVKYSVSADNLAQSFPTPEPIEAGGREAYFSTLDGMKMAAYLSARSIPASVSFTAGTFVCNNLMYDSLKFCSALKIPAGFVHLPLSYEIAAREGAAGEVTTLPQSVLTEGVIALTEFTVSNLLKNEG